jgi:hypothetical protein
MKGYTGVDISRLDSGYTFIRLNSQCWAQIPEGFSGETVPDEYIFQPEWNRAAINKIWKDIYELKMGGV